MLRKIQPFADFESGQKRDAGAREVKATYIQRTAQAESIQGRCHSTRHLRYPSPAAVHTGASLTLSSASLNQGCSSRASRRMGEGGRGKAVSSFQKCFQMLLPSFLILVKPTCVHKAEMIFCPQTFFVK